MSDLTYGQARLKGLELLGTAESRLSTAGGMAYNFNEKIAYALMASQYTELAKVYLRIAGDMV